MKGTKYAAILLIIAIFGMVQSHSFTEEEDVLVLGEDDFDAAIKHFEIILVEFYAPWCGHCKTLAPHYAKAAATLKKEDPPLALAKIDATIHKALATRFGVEGFPTLKLFINGTPQEYQGGRTEAEIVSYMRKKSGPSTRVLTTVAEVEALHSGVDVALVFMGDDATQLATFQKFAGANDDIVFGICASDECLTHYKVAAGNVVMFKNFDDRRNDLTETLTEDNLKAFVAQHGSPLVMKFDEKSAQLIFGKSTPGLFLYRDNNSEQTAEFDRLFATLATSLKGKLQVIVTDIKEGLETRLAEYIGVTSKDLPTVRIHDTRSDLKKYTMEGEINQKNVEDFVDRWVNGKLVGNLKSEEIPETQDGDVVVLVGKNFNQIVLDPTKDVLVEFYAPWCGHCKKLVPIYDELAANLKHNTNLVIAKMDSTANEVDGVSVSGFPTIKFWPAGNKSAPMDFEGDRTVEGFTAYLAKHSTNSVVQKDDL